MQSLFAKLLVSCVSLIVSLLLGETIFRMLDIKHPDPKKGTWRDAVLPRTQCLPGVRYQFRPNSEFHVTYGSNPDGYFDEHNRLYYRLNNYGFRGPDYRMKKKPGTYRIIVIGDSFTLGDGVKLEDTFCMRLQERLRKIDTGVEVFNFGTSGWNSRDEINYFRLMGIRFDPDLVIVVYVLNDGPFELGPARIWRDEIEDAAEEGFWTDSYLLDYLNTMSLRDRLNKRYVRQLQESMVTHEPQWQRSFEWLLRGKKLADKHGIRYMIAAFPFLYQLNDNYPFHSLHEQLRNFSQNQNIPFLDLFPAFENHDYFELWAHPSDQHPNAKGHRIAAEALAEFIVSYRLL